MAQERWATVRRAGLVVGWVTTLCSPASALPGTQSPSPAQPGSSGTFTQAQASRGETVYAQSCASCHGAALIGGSAPALTGREFQVSWSHPRLTLDDIFFIQRTTMPPRASATVSPDDHAAVFAYLLQVNGYPAGTTPLSAGAAALPRPPPRKAAVPPRPRSPPGGPNPPPPLARAA